ncbi:MAG: hypothetical protein ACRC2J_09670, partial [Microcoleaceae cyanobacterium]
KTMGGKGVWDVVDKMWPLCEEDLTGGKEMSKEEKNAIIMRHKLLLAQKRKQDGRDETTDRG